LPNLFTRKSANAPFRPAGAVTRPVSVRPPSVCNYCLLSSRFLPSLMGTQAFKYQVLKDPTEE
jgi:hypothetical protein